MQSLHVQLCDPSVGSHGSNAYTASGTLTSGCSLQVQVVRSKHKVRAFVFSPATKRGGLAQLALSLANNTIEVCLTFLCEVLISRAQDAAPPVLMAAGFGLSYFGVLPTRLNVGIGIGHATAMPSV